MFLLNELILASPLVLYTWFRLWRLAAGKLAKSLLTAGFVLLAAAYPIAETLSHRGGGSWTRPVMLAGYASLPLLLYLGLAVVASDLAIGGLRLAKVLSRDAVRGPRFRRLRLGLALAIPAAFVLAGLVNYHVIKVRHYAVEIPRRTSTVERLRVVFAADFHLGGTTAAGFMPRVVEKVNAQNPDLVLIGGDVLEGDRGGQPLEEFESQFRRLESKYGVYAVPGNHERYRGGRRDFFDRAGITLLEDAVVKIDSALYLAGRRDARSRARKPVDGLLAGAAEDLPVILLDHRPTDLERVSLSRVDIQLSGHTHDGQLFPLNLVYALRYELSYGYLKKRGTHFFVTSGLGLWGPPVRTAGRTEILVIDVLLRNSGTQY
jgi:predicted MPP superfamily phosphohydrolase